MYVYGATVRRIIDADTMAVTIDLGFFMSMETTIRLSRIDAWEMRGEERPRGELATEFVKQRIGPGSTIRIQTFKTGNFGRWLSEVWFIDEAFDGCEGIVERNLNDLLVDEGHAEYTGR